jgi:hypothetical protein
MTSPARFSRFVAAPALAALTLAAVVGCQSTPNAGGAPSSAAPSGDAQVLSIGRQYSQCVRDHGIPTFPDLVLLAGHLTIPDNAAGQAGEQALQGNQSARTGCAPIMQQLPAGAQKNQGPSSQERTNLVKYSQCMRQHGVPEWPDPDANGGFPISGTPLISELKSQRVMTAEQACQQFFNGEISVK